MRKMNVRPDFCNNKYCCTKRLSKVRIAGCEVPFKEFRGAKFIIQIEQPIEWFYTFLSMKQLSLEKGYERLFI